MSSGGAGLCVVPVLLLYALRLRWLAYPSAFLMLLVACYSFVGLRFGAPSIGVLESILHTNTAEAYEQCTAVPASHLLMFIAALVSLCCFVRGVRRTSSPWWVWVIGLVLFIPTLQNGLNFKRFRESTTYVLLHYREELNELERNAHLTSDWQLHSLRTATGKIFVIVMGESARADYFSAYGYPLPTSPFLEKHATLKFDDAVSPATNTLLSVPRSLSINDDFLHVRHAYDAVTLARAAGLETWWLSAQGRTGFSDTGITHIASRSDHPVFLQQGDYDSRNVDDYELLPLIMDAVRLESTRDKAIFVHTLGSHQDPCRRVADYPLIDRAGWSPHFSCYVTSIRKTDALLEQIDTVLKASHHPYELIYTADHGVYIDNDTMQHSQQTREAYHVPLILVDSEHPDRHDTVATAFDMRHFIDLFADQLGVQTPLLTSLA